MSETLTTWRAETEADLDAARLELAEATAVLAEAETERKAAVARRDEHAALLAGRGGVISAALAHKMHPANALVRQADAAVTRAMGCVQNARYLVSNHEAALAELSRLAAPVDEDAA